MNGQVHVGDMIWCDGFIVAPPTRFSPDDTTVVYYLTLACHDEQGNTTYVDAKAVKKTAHWVSQQSWAKGQDVILKGVITTPETVGLDGRNENMKIRILNIATHTSRQADQS